MAGTSTNPNRYVPGDMPTLGSIDELREYVNRELQRVSILVNMLADGQIERSYAPPEKLNDGMIRYADGATWNPGSGRGIYFYDATSMAWKLLG